MTNLGNPDCISQIHHGKSSLSQQFSITNLGNTARIWSCPEILILSRFCKFIMKGSRTNHIQLCQEECRMTLLRIDDWTGLTGELLSILGEHVKTKFLLISSNSALSTGVANDAIEEDNAWATWLILSTTIAHYWVNYLAKFEVQWTIHNWNTSCKSLHIFSLSTGVDNDANEEEYAFVLVTTNGWLGSWYT